MVRGVCTVQGLRFWEIDLKRGTTWPVCAHNHATAPLILGEGRG